MAETNPLSPAAQLLTMHLHRVRFKDEGGSEAERAQVSSEFLLSAQLFGDQSVGVEFGVRFRAHAGLAAQVIYRLHFARGPGTPESFSDEDFARHVSARLAPVVAFPFVRETVASLTGKSGDMLLLPVVNVGAMFSPDEIVLSREEANYPKALKKPRSAPRKAAEDGARVKRDKSRKSKA